MKGKSFRFMVKEQLTELIAAAYYDAARAGELPLLEELPSIELDMPKVRAHGDYASNIAMILAKPLKMPPRAVADALARHLAEQDLIKAVEVAGPGFLNFTLHPDWLHEILRRIEREGDDYGKSKTGEGVSVLVEFVSANPNGPITVAHGRGGAIGDALASLLAAVGHPVQREFYINDALNSKQMNNFGKSVHLRYMQLLGHDVEIQDADWLYKGDYLTDIARGIVERDGSAYAQSDINDPSTVQLFRDLAQRGMHKQQEDDLKAFGIVFDRWFSEQTVHESGAVKRAIDEITAKGYTYELDGALWLKSTEFGDDKDRVLMRADGTPTYIAGDVAYHLDKLSRFDKLIDIWGADHFGYVSRTKAAISASGEDASRVHVLLFQLVRIMKNGEFVRSSKRAGDVLELRADLVDEIGKDAARFYFLMRSSDTALDIDVDLAKEQSSKNPVFYVQYAHARACNVLEKAIESGVSVLPTTQTADLNRLTEITESDVIKKLSEWPEEVVTAAALYAPHRITQYARDLAAAFHTFYDAGNNDPAARVLTDDSATRDARLVLIVAVRTVLKNALTLLGLSAPERM